MPKQSPLTKQWSKELKFVLNEEHGYYEIGPQKDDNQIFVLSVTIGLASNLAKVGFLEHTVIPTVILFLCFFVCGICQNIMLCFLRDL